MEQENGTEQEAPETTESVDLTQWVPVSAPIAADSPILGDRIAEQEALGFTTKTVAIPGDLVQVYRAVEPAPKPEAENDGERADLDRPDQERLQADQGRFGRENDPAPETSASLEEGSGDRMEGPTYDQ